MLNECYQVQAQRASLKELGSCTWQAQAYCACQETPEHTVGCSHALIKGENDFPFVEDTTLGPTTLFWDAPFLLKKMLKAKERHGHCGFSSCCHASVELDGIISPALFDLRQSLYLVLIGLELARTSLDQASLKDLPHCPYL